MKCLVCSDPILEPHFKALLRCTNCGFITANSNLSLQDLQDLYGAGYFSGDEYWDYLGDKKIIQKNLSRWLKEIKKYSPSGSLVEIGCAYGFFLELARYSFDAVGYDLCAEAITYANNVPGNKAKHGDFLTDTALGTESVDNVVMWDVIEHLPNPSEFIKRSSTILKPAGHIFITTGDIDAWLPKKQGPNWRMIHPPTHLQYFSSKTLQLLLESHGFEICNITYPGYWRSIGQILHGLGKFGSRTRKQNYLTLAGKLIPLHTSVYLNTFDIMFVSARKI